MRRRALSFSSRYSADGEDVSKHLKAEACAVRHAYGFKGS